MPTEPLLTIAIPTCNRAALLEGLLTVLMPQLATHADVELLILDNGSTDATPEVIERYRTATTRILRHAENIGSDANFVAAFREARGRYFWLCGDDDIPVPNAIDELMGHLRTTELDLVYLTSYGFREDWRTERQADPLGRSFHTISDPRHLTIVVNMMFTFISGMVVNRARLLALPSEGISIEAPEAFLGTNLTQLSWTLPLLRRHRRSLVLWNRPIAARQGHNGGYALAKVFGERLVVLVERCLPDRPDLARLMTNFSIRRWFPSIIYDIRATGNRDFALDEAHATLARVFGGNPRYWFFTYPVLKLPLPLAKLWLRVGEAISKLIYMATVPGFWRKQS
jgi:glycosyltransferase involved in cell wall biosynthesis